MRWLVVLIVVVLPALAVAKPKVAVAPLDGDSDSKIADIVVNAADDHAKVVRPEKVSRAMESLGVTTFNGKGLKKLRTNLEVDLVIYGTVEKTGSKHKLELTIAGKGKKKETVSITYKSTKNLKKDLSSQLRQKVSDLLGGDEDPEDDDPPPKKEEPFKKHDEDEHPKKHDDDDHPKKHADDDRPKKHDDDRPKHRVADDDTSTRKRHGDDDEEETRHRHRKHKDERNPLTQAALWLDVGAELARRTLTWKGGGDIATMPPHVGTAAAAGRINGEVYPAGFDKVDGTGAIGFYGELGYTLGLSIGVPGTSNSVPIKDGHYAIGARYRYAFGTSSVAFGASYWRRYYIADQSALMMGQTLDMPSVDYTAIAPGILARFAATPTVAAYASADLPLVLQSGDIQSATSYGRGKVIAFDLRAGLQITVAPHYAVAIAAEFDQIGISFEAGQNSKAMTRGVSGATDRTIAFTAAIGIDY